MKEDVENAVSLIICENP